MRGSALVAGSVTWLLPAFLAAQSATGEAAPVQEGDTPDEAELHQAAVAQAAAASEPAPAEDAPAPAPSAAEAQASGNLQLEAATPAEASASAPPPTAAEQRWPDADPLRLSHNTWFGSTGGVRVIDGASGAPGSLRFQLGFDYFGASDFLEVNDKHRYTSGTLSLSATPIEHLEVFASATSYSSSNNSGNPILLQGSGNFSLGAKGYVKLQPW